MTTPTVCCCVFVRVCALPAVFLLREMLRTGFIINAHTLVYWMSYRGALLLTDSSLRNTPASAHTSTQCISVHFRGLHRSKESDPLRKGPEAFLPGPDLREMKYI